MVCLFLYFCVLRIFWPLQSSFEADATSISVSSLIKVHGRVDRLSMVLLGAEERSEASCSQSVGFLLECEAASCLDSACEAQSATISPTTQTNVLQQTAGCFTTSMQVYVGVGILSCAMLLSAVLLYGCIECMRRGSPNVSSDRIGHTAAATPILELNQMNQESSHFSCFFMLTLIEHLFGEQSRHSTLNCGILLVPEQRPVEHLLRALKIDTSRVCKAPVTHERLCHYGSAPIGCLRIEASTRTDTLSARL